MKTYRRIFLLATALFCASASAQFRVEVSGVGLTQVPIAVTAFKGDDTAPQKMGAIVQADLARSGQFKPVDTTGVQMDENARPDVSAWRQKPSAAANETVSEPANHARAESHRVRSLPRSSSGR